MRDDFDAKTKRILAERVGFRCSNPDCRKLTSGPQISSDRAVNIGVAAHIIAAAPGGPRYDPTLSPEERRSAENGIWLCQSCAKLIDSDPNRYTVDLLRKWKHQAEEEAFREIVGSSNAFSLRDPLQVLSKLLDAPAEWVKVEGDTYIRHQYRPEFVIRINYETASKFEEPWVRRFPDKDAEVVVVEYWQSATILKKSRFVIVDGGRYLIPLPELRSISASEDKSGWESMKFVIDTSSIEWKTAKIFDQHGSLEQMLIVAGILFE